MSNGIARVEVDEQSLAALRSLFNAKQVNKIVYSAVKKTTTQAKGVAAKAVMERLAIPRRYIDGKNHRKAAIKSSMRGGDVPVGVITIRRYALPASAFKMQATKAGGVSVTFDKSKGPQNYRHGFIANVKSDEQDAQGTFHKGAFVRAKETQFIKNREQTKFTKAGIAFRLPIKEIFGPAVLDFITLPEIQSRVIRDIQGVLQKNLDSQISRFTGGQFKSLAAAIAAGRISSADPEENENEFGEL